MLLALLLLLLLPCSVPVVPLQEVVLEAGASPLITDHALRDSLIQVITATGQAVETAFRGVPQDVEGVWFDGGLVVVQSRPQVMPVTATPAARV
jgi:hypothetical protein